MTRIVELLPAERILKGPAASLKIGEMYDRTAMGIEVELENAPSDDLGPDRRKRFLLPSGSVLELQHGIDAHRDGSLRNNGIELVTPPLRGENVSTAIRYMCTLADEQGWQASNRAGIHVHIDVQTLTIPELLNVLATYTLVEPALFRWIGEGRHDSLFCKAWTDDSVTEELEQYIQHLNMIERDGGGALWRMHTRYTALNLESIRKYGTIEFRQMRSTLDPDRMIKWCNIIQVMRSWAVANPLTRERVSEFNSATILREVFGPTLGNELHYSEFDSYYNLRAVPMCNQLFFPPPKAKPTWDIAPKLVKKAGTHRGYTRFTKGKAKVEQKRDGHMFIPPRPARVRNNPRREFVVADDIPPTTVGNAEWMNAWLIANPVPPQPLDPFIPVEDDAVRERERVEVDRIIEDFRAAQNRR